MFAAGAQAVHTDGFFELDNNAVDNAGPGVDWANVYAAVQANPNTKCDAASGVEALGAIECSWVHDPDGQSTFTTGGSKDDLDINNWLHTSGSVPDKDEIEDAYAAMYVNSDDEQILYFGADRLANNGSADFGFWFFQTEVVANPNGTFTTTTGSPAHHVLGDILLLGTFTQGGAATNIRAFEWVGSGGNVNGTLNDPGVTLGDCDTTPAGDSGCGTVNGTAPDPGATSPWAYVTKFSDPSTVNPHKNQSKDGIFPSGTLYEGGINLSDFDLEGCFSTFAAETRSSAEVSAQLKDFVLGSFESCGATMTTDASSNSFEIGGSVSDSATINVTGANPPAPTGNVLFYLCGPASGQSSCSTSGTLKATINLSTASVNGNNYTVSSGSITPTVAGDYCFFATWAGDVNYPAGASVTNFSDECFTVTPKQPGIITQVSNAGPVVPGTAVSDSATLSNTAAPSNGTNGTITFRAYGPDDATCATVVYTSVIGVTGNGTYSSANGDGGPFAPTAPGVYRWRAFYAPAAGDVNNLSANTPCNDANESFTVEQFQPALTTLQTWTVKDEATVTVSGGGNLAGSVTFELHRTANCSDTTPILTQTVPVAGPSGTKVETTPQTITVSEPILYWKVSYASTNGAHKNIAATCTENSSLAVNN